VKMLEIAIGVDFEVKKLETLDAVEVDAVS
jgi:hypothetical protein